MRHEAGVAVALFFLCPLLAGCLGSSQSVAIKDVAIGETLNLRKAPSQGNAHGLRVRGSGSISGTAEIQLIENGAPYKKEMLGGAVQFTWDGDWYADQAEIRYLPLTATAGSLMLEFQFRD